MLVLEVLEASGLVMISGARKASDSSHVLKQSESMMRAALRSCTEDAEEKLCLLVGKEGHKAKGSAQTVSAGLLTKLVVEAFSQRSMQVDDALTPPSLTLATAKDIVNRRLDVFKETMNLSSSSLPLSIPVDLVVEAMEGARLLRSTPPGSKASPNGTEYAWAGPDLVLVDLSCMLPATRGRCGVSRPKSWRSAADSVPSRQPAHMAVPKRNRDQEAQPAPPFRAVRLKLVHPAARRGGWSTPFLGRWQPAKQAKPPLLNPRPVRVVEARSDLGAAPQRRLDVAFDAEGVADPDRRPGPSEAVVAEACEMDDDMLRALDDFVAELTENIMPEDEVDLSPPIPTTSRSEDSSLCRKFFQAEGPADWAGSALPAAGARGGPHAAAPQELRPVKKKSKQQQPQAESAATAAKSTRKGRPLRDLPLLAQPSSGRYGALGTDCALPKPAKRPTGATSVCRDALRPADRVPPAADQGDMMADVPVPRSTRPIVGGLQRKAVAGKARSNHDAPSSPSYSGSDIFAEANVRIGKLQLTSELAVGPQ